MANEIIINFVGLVIGTGLAAIIIYAVSYFKDMRAKIKDERVEMIVDQAVAAAEQLLATQTGPEKKDAVIAWLEDYLNEKGIKVSANELNMLIESTVYYMNQELYDDVDE